MQADAYLSLGDLGDATAAVERLKELIREMNDPELPQYVSSQLASAAARLFAKDQHDRANTALSRELATRHDPPTLLDRLDREGARGIGRVFPPQLLLGDHLLH